MTIDTSNRDREDGAEVAFKPQLEVVDTHIHLWNAQGYDYFAPHFLSDVEESGHRVDSSIYVECDMGYSTDAPEEMRPVGETAYVLRQVELAGSSKHQLAAAILGSANLRLGDRVRPVLDAHIAGAQGRFRGIRYRAAWDPDPLAQYRDPGYPDRYILREPSVLDGAKCLAELGLVLSIWLFHTQHEDLLDLASRCPDLRITTNHMGGPLGVGRYAGMRDEIFKQWSAGLRKLSQAPNVSIQIGGIGTSRLGYRPPSGRAAASDEIVQDWQPYVDCILEHFGSKRVMFGSNFPVDRRLSSYRTYINAFKQMIAGLSEHECELVLSRNAKEFFGIA